MSDTPQAKTPPRRLGRGLDALLSPAPVAVTASERMPTPAVENPSTASTAAAELAEQADPSRVIVMIPVENLHPSPFQPRRGIDPATLIHLANSIKQSGMMQPIVVRALRSGGYELIAGERRWRAAMDAGLLSVPAILRDVTDLEAAELALVENVQREDLNAIEKGWALRTLSDRFNLTQSDLAARVSLERSTVANLIRLTELEPEICEMIQRGELTGAHGKALLAIPAGEARLNLAREAAANEWTTKRVEYLAKAHSIAPEQVGSKRESSSEITARHAVLRDLERQLGQHLGTKVIITTDHSGKKGKLSLEFYSIDHFDGLLNRLGISTPCD
jgi:ParB family chromosome partitioning protein